MYKGSKQMRFESLSIMRLELYGHRALKRSKEYGKKTTSALLPTSPQRGLKLYLNREKLGEKWAMLENPELEFI